MRPGTRLVDWVSAHPIDPALNYKAAAEKQIERFKELGQLCGDEGRVVSHHTSKSVKLPVMQFELGIGQGTILVRDNFYDICVGIDWTRSPQIPLSSFWKPLDWAWYKEEVDKCRGYSYRGWTDEEMNDPRILRVKVTTSSGGGGYWSERRGDEKDRWARRDTDPSWYSKDWSRSKIVHEGTFGPGCTMYSMVHGFCEGFAEGGASAGMLQMWEPGRAEGHFCFGSWHEGVALVRWLRDEGRSDS